MKKIILSDDGYSCLDKLFAQIQRNNMMATEQMINEAWASYINLPPYMADGLVVKEKWGNLILDDMKYWEIRGSNTTKRGTYFLVYSGTNQVYGHFTLVDSFPVTREMLEENINKHRIGNIDEIFKVYKNPHAWVISNPVKYATPFPYTHPQGAVIWVKDIKRA